MQSYFDPNTGELIGGEISSEPRNNSQYQQNNQWYQQNGFQEDNQWYQQQNYQQDYQWSQQQNYQQDNQWYHQQDNQWYQQQDYQQDYQQDSQWYQQQNYQQDNQWYQQQNYQEDNQWYQQQNYQQDNQWYQQPNFQEIQKPKTSKGAVRKKLFLGIGISVGAIAIVGVIVFVVSQFIMSNPISKIGMAVANTCKGGELFNAFNTIDILRSDEIQDQILVETDGMKVFVSRAYQQSEERKITTVKVDADIEGEKFDIEGTLELDKDKIAINVPQLNDTVYAYYYKQENDGVLTEEFDEEIINMLNNGLTKIYEFGYSNNSKEVRESFLKVISDELNTLAIEELEKEKFEVNGKNVQCGGYLVTVTKDNIVNITDGLVKIYNEYYSDSTDELLNVTGMDIDSIFNDAEDSIEDVPDIELYFYLYKSQLACVKIQVKGEEGALYTYFHGGDYPAQNMEIIFDDKDDTYNIFKMDGTIKNHVETVIFEIDEKELCEINYNQKTGEFVVSGIDYGKFNLSGAVTRKSDTFMLVLNKLEIDGIQDNIDISAKYMISAEADIKSLNGEIFDIGNASEEDFENLANDLVDFVDDIEIVYDLFN